MFRWKRINENAGLILCLQIGELESEELISEWWNMSWHCNAQDGGSGNFCKIKGAGVFERPGQTMGELSVFGTSRTSNGLKSGP